MSQPISGGDDQNNISNQPEKELDNQNQTQNHLLPMDKENYEWSKWTKMLCQNPRDLKSSNACIWLLICSSAHLGLINIVNE